MAAFLWLGPSEYIFRTQLLSLQKSAPDFSVSHVCFQTYASLLSGTHTLIGLHIDYIILDEFHRVGSEHWGAAVKQVLADHPEAKVLGLSATQIRYLDHRRDMAEELFGQSIAAQMTVGEAVVRGILPVPKYVTTVYQYQQGLERYQQRINRMTSRRQQNKCEKYLQALRRTIEKADGLDVVFARHMTDRHGKYIVFCSNVEHLIELKSHSDEWFRLIDNKPNCYQVFAESAESSGEYEAFLQDDSMHLKLLFCVNMLNEGIHAEGISGVILFRPTVSPIIYKQQIGRALNAGKTNEPLIIDVVNNVEGLYSIDTLTREMEDAIQRFRAENRSELIVHERFHVIDQVQDCRKLFEQMEDSLHIDWEEYYQAATSYWEAYGNLQIPQRYVTADGKCQGSWLATQRKIYNGNRAGSLTLVQIERLERIGIVWDNLKDQLWETLFSELRKYKEKYGHLDIPSSYIDTTGFALGKWVGRMRIKWQQKVELSSLEQEQLKRLDELGFVWDYRQYQWQINIAHARQYYKEEGNLMVPINYKTRDGFALGAWIFNLRSARRGNIAMRPRLHRIKLTN